MPADRGIDPMLIAAASGLLAESDKVSAGTDHSGEAGHARETAVLEALRSLLPGRFAVRRGSVIGKAGVISQQLDVVVCDLDNFPEFAYGSDTSLLLPDSVLGVVSVRTYLRTSDVRTHFDEAASLKSFMTDAAGAHRKSPSHASAREHASTFELAVEQALTRPLASHKVVRLSG